MIGYACIYKASEKHVGDIELDDISITMVRERYPRKLFSWLKKNKFTIHEKYPGIFYIMKNADLQIQIIVSKRLSPKSQTWLTLLNDNLDVDNAKRAIRQADGLQHKDEKEYADSVLQVAITENRRIFERMKEEGDQIMCEALKELMKPELTEATEKAIQQGSRNKLLELIRKKLAKGQNVDQIADALEESVETIQQLIKEYKLI